MSNDVRHDPTTKKTFSQKWGDDPFTSIGYTQVPNALIHYAARLELRSEECWLICCVLKFKFDESNPTPRQEDLAKLFGQSVDTVQRTAKKMVTKNLLRVEHVRGDLGRFTHMVYDFTPLRHALNECYYADHPQDRPRVPSAARNPRPQKRGVGDDGDQTAEMRPGNEIDPDRESAARSTPQKCGSAIYKDPRTDSKTLLNQDKADSSSELPDEKTPQTLSAAALVDRLLASDVNRSDAVRLASQVPEECCRQLEYLPFVSTFRSGKGAYLRSAIEGSYGAPKAYREAQQKEQRAQKRARIQQSRAETFSPSLQEPSSVKPPSAQEARLQTATEEAQADAVLWEEIVTEAKKRMPPIIRERSRHPTYAPTLQACVDAIVAERAGLECSAGKE